MRSFFDELFGNDDLKAKLTAFVKNGNFPHSSMIVGESGSGKRTLAKLIAMALNCERQGKEQSIPCGICNNCKRIKEDNFPDVKSCVLFFAAFIASLWGKANPIFVIIAGGIAGLLIY